MLIILHVNAEVPIIAMASDDRSWMYNRFGHNQSRFTEEFIRGVKHFIEFSVVRKNYMHGEKIRCPCSKCKNHKFETSVIVEKHLFQHGFVPNYTKWIAQGEQLPKFVYPNNPPVNETGTDMNTDMPEEGEESDEGMEDMVRDAAGFDVNWEENVEEEPNADAKKFYDVMKAAKKPLYTGSERNLLETVVEYLSIKATNNMSQSCYNQVVAAAKRGMPSDNCMVGSFYETTKLVKKLGLSYEKIDACKNQCMLFYKENESKTVCDFCKASRYKPDRRGSAKRKKNIPWKQLRYMPLIPRLQRLYASKGNAEAMRWHKESPREEGVLVHPSDGEAWKHFDAKYPDYAAECRNVRLGICSDGFNPYGPGAKAYSCWPVIVTPYNLPPWLCMNDPYMFCTLFIPGPHSPGKNIDVYLRPLIDELTVLWTDGVQTWDAYKKQNFNMKASVMWTINDFPAYGMLSGWSTHGKMACPYCMDDVKSFNLPHSKKACWFDCHRRFLPKDHSFRTQKSAFTKNREEHSDPPEILTGEELASVVAELPDVKFGRTFEKEQIDGYHKKHKWTKRSIFWELPYWKTNLIRHNLDVMHIEKNVFDNIFNTVMDFKGTSKDTVKARMDMADICRRPNLELKEVNGKMVKPVAPYVLPVEKRLQVLQWLKTLKLPDGYSSNIGNSVNLDEMKMQGLKSHDCHVLLDRLIPVAFRGLLPDHIWVALTELSEFFRAVTSSTLRVEDMKRLEESIVVTICKLEKIFPPSFFDSMEHLPIHLAYEARVGGPVQYRWMYPFERFLGSLKRKLSNRARVEASIAEAVVIDEIVAFASNYHSEEVQKSLSKRGRNYDGGYPEPNDDCISVFKFPGRFISKKPYMRRTLSQTEFEAARLFVLLNCDEVDEYIK